MPRLAVLGQPIAHSRSPAMQNAALAELGLTGEWSYEAIEVAPEDFEARVRAMPGEGFAGANVTVPHKVAALRVADEASEPARAIGAANTLSFSDGRIAAENTDATGFLDALPGDPAGGRALVLGAGGSARAVAWALASRDAKVTIWNRTPEKARRLAEGLGVSALGAGDRWPGAGEFDLLVNCTTVGMGEGGADLKALPLDADAMGERHTIVDLAYGPAETELVRAARARGAAVIDGLEVLVRQGAASLRIWTGLDPPIETMRQAARQQDATRESPPISEAGPRPGGGDGTQT
jgi:shikimate dehydrogenase